ncbi:hypothetical protein CMV60_10375 [Serratia marcescens]|nr:hypothetical protein CMV60_10375 [Serratia marcescens]
MDKQQEESRKQFEKYFDDAYGCQPTDSHDPRHVEVIWHVWQASRASIVVDVPQACAFNLCDLVSRDDVIKAIRSIDLSIKGE